MDKKLEAVKFVVSIIKYINNPDKELQIQAVKSNGDAIQFISNPDKLGEICADTQRSAASPGRFLLRIHAKTTIQNNVGKAEENLFNSQKIIALIYELKAIYKNTWPFGIHTFVFKLFINNKFSSW
jgi:hypothetical protein